MTGLQRFERNDVTPLAHTEVTSVADLTRLTPENVHEALQCMDTALELFHARDDSRAIFLRCYRIMTSNVFDALERQRGFGSAIFFDPDWITCLSGRFATLYFRSLRDDAEGDGTSTRPEETLTRTQPWKRGRAWTIAHEEARRDRLSVTQQVLFGINAHINYDLPYALYQNLVAHGDHEHPYTQLYRRKFDHDQINNLLVDSVPEVQEALGSAYGGFLGVMTTAVFGLDDLLAKLGLKYYRERVWWDAVSFLVTRDDGGAAPSRPGDTEFTLVRDKLDWESWKLAESIRDSLGPIGRAAALARRGNFGPFEPT